MRSFAHDLGVALGAGAHLSALRRTGSGDFEAADAVPFGDLLRDGSTAAARLLPIEGLLPSLPAVTVTAAGAVRVRHGNDLRPEELVSGSDLAVARCRVFDQRGALLAIAEPSGKAGILHPCVVVG